MNAIDRAVAGRARGLPVLLSAAAALMLVGLLADTARRRRARPRRGNPPLRR